MKKATERELQEAPTLLERILIHNRQFEVGDNVSFILDGVELEGKIVQIEGDHDCRVGTKYGDFGAKLSMVQFVG